MRRKFEKANKRNFQQSLVGIVGGKIFGEKRKGLTSDEVNDVLRNEI